MLQNFHDIESPVNNNLQVAVMVQIYQCRRCHNAVIGGCGNCHRPTSGDLATVMLPSIYFGIRGSYYYLKIMVCIIVDISDCRRGKS